jgi:hypothetical protein
MEGEPILKKTLYTVAVMIAAWTAFVGTVSIVAVMVTTLACLCAHAGSVADDAPFEGDHAAVAAPSAQQPRAADLRRDE